MKDKAVSWWYTRVVPVVAAVAFIFLLWWLIWKLNGDGLFPSPLAVLEVAANLVVTGEFLSHFLTTMKRIVIGASLAIVAATAMVATMKGGSWLRRFFQVQITVGLTIPSLAWSVVGIILFGLRDAAAIFTVFAVILPVMATTLDQGVRAMDRDLFEMAQIYKLERGQILRTIVIPQLWPYLFAAARYGLSLSWKTVVITEMLGLTSGLGYQISYYFGLLSLKHVLAWILVFTSSMLIIEYGLIQRLETRLFRWRPRSAHD